MWVGVAVALALLAAVFFDRFDPARGGWRSEKKEKPAEKSKAGELALPQAAEQNGHSAPARASAAHLKTFKRTAPRTRFFALVIAELRLLLRGHGWWWYAGAAGLFIGCVASSLDDARTGVIAAAWLWPILVWSQMGTRESQYSTGALIFSAPRAVPRQLLATYAAGVLVAMLTGGGLPLHLLFAGDIAALGGWAAGAFFIPALALGLGVTTGTRKAFEAIYTMWWYVGPLHHIPQLDFMGTTAASSTPVRFLLYAVLLVVLAYSWRTVRLRYA
jgi:hypothetical protein